MNVKKRFEGKVAIVTGGGQGIGRACAKLFASEGASVVIAELSPDPGQQVVSEIESEGGRASLVLTDVSIPADVKELMLQVKDKYGKLDILHNNAGIHETKLTDVASSYELDDDLWSQVINVNLKGTWMCSKYAVPLLESGGGGVIVNAASIGGMVGYPMGSAYGPSKAGIVQLTRGMALELASKSIRVNCYAPGNVDTPMVSDYYTQAPEDERESLMRQMIDTHLIHRLGHPDEIANVVIFLASDASTFMTGTCVTVDGGTLAWRGMQG